VQVLVLRRWEALSQLDTSSSPCLVRLEVRGCQALCALDVHRNTALRSLAVCGCGPSLTHLDVSYNTRLTALDCSRNALAALQLGGGLPALRTLRCAGNKLTSLPLAAAPALQVCVRMHAEIAGADGE
jgi:hypothetical protein